MGDSTLPMCQVENEGAMQGALELSSSSSSSSSGSIHSAQAYFKTVNDTLISMLGKDLGFFEPKKELKMLRYTTLVVLIPPISQRSLLKAVIT
jgi:hypothetical protein